MHRVLSKGALSPNVTRLDVSAPRIARVRQPGQLVIVHLKQGAERIPLIIADADPSAGSITLVIQAVGKSTWDPVCGSEASTRQIYLGTVLGDTVAGAVANFLIVMLKTQFARSGRW